MARARKKRRWKFKLFVFMLFILSLFFLSMHITYNYIFPLKYENKIIQYSREYDLDSYLVMGIISSESGFDENAKSHKNAKGLMQLKEDTAKWCVEKFDMLVSYDELYNPQTNIKIGCRYLSYLTEIFYQKEETAIAAYNAGQGNVGQWLRNPDCSDDGISLKKIPFPETADYVKRVLDRKDIYSILYDGSPSAKNFIRFAKKYVHRIEELKPLAKDVINRIKSEISIK